MIIYNVHQYKLDSVYIKTMVRTHYRPVDESVFRTLFKEERLLHGGRYTDNDISVFRSATPYIRGSGWFSRIGIPLLRKYIAPNLLEFGSNVLSDITSGQSPKTSIKKRGIESLKKTVKKVLTGQGRKKMGNTKRKNKKKYVYVKKKSHKPKLGGKKTTRKKVKRKVKHKTKNKFSKCIFDRNFRI